MSCQDQVEQFKLHAGSDIRTNSPVGISLDEVRRFINKSYTYENSPFGQSNRSIRSLMTAADAANMDTAFIGYNFVSPHRIEEFLGLNYLNNEAPTLSLNGNSTIDVTRSYDNATGYTFVVGGQTIRGALMIPIWTIPSGYQCIAFGNGICSSTYLNTNVWNDIVAPSLWLEDGRMIYQSQIGPKSSMAQSIFGSTGAQLHGGAPTYPTGGWAKSGNNLIVHTRELWGWQGGVWYWPICNDDIDISFNGSGCSSTIVNYFSNINNTGYWCNVDCATHTSQGPYGGWQFRMQEIDYNTGNNVPAEQNFLYDIKDVGSGAPYIYKDPGATANDREQGNITSQIRTIVTFYDIHNIFGSGTSTNFVIHLHGWYVSNGYLERSPTSSYTHFANRSININYNAGVFGTSWLDATIPGRYEFEYSIDDVCGEYVEITRNVYVLL